MVTQIKNAFVRKQEAMLMLTIMLVYGATASATTKGLAFKPFYDMIEGWASGYLGAGISVAALVFGIASGVFKGSLVGIAVAVGGALGLVVGSGVLGGMFSALI